MTTEHIMWYNIIIINKGVKDVMDKQELYDITSHEFDEQCRYECSYRHPNCFMIRLGWLYAGNYKCTDKEAMEKLCEIVRSKVKKDKDLCGYYYIKETALIDILENFYKLAE